MGLAVCTDACISQAPRGGQQVLPRQKQAPAAGSADGSQQLSTRACGDKPASAGDTPAPQGNSNRRPSLDGRKGSKENVRAGSKEKRRSKSKEIAPSTADQGPSSNREAAPSASDQRPRSNREAAQQPGKEVAPSFFDQPRPLEVVQQPGKEGVLLSPTSRSPLMQRRSSKNKPPNGPWRASHILFKHTGSRNPVSRRTQEKVTRTKEEAAMLLGRVLPSLTCGNFAEKAIEYSDCSSYAQGGDLDWFNPDEMQQPFEEAVRSLAVGELSREGIDTDSGLHVVLRTG